MPYLVWIISLYHIINVWINITNHYNNMFIDWARDITDTKPEVKYVNLCFRNSGVTCFVLIMAADVTKTQITLLILPKQFSYYTTD